MMIGIGCDIVNIHRIEKIMKKEGYLKLLTKKEQALFHSFHTNRQIEWLAGRFVAKEAIYKAIHQHFPCLLSDIEILSDEKGAPICTFTKCHIEISIAHEKDYAIAYAIATSKE